MTDADDPAVEHVDAEGTEECPVEAASGLVIGMIVGVVRVSAERDHLGDQVGAGAQLDVDVGDALFDAVARLALMETAPVALPGNRRPGRGYFIESGGGVFEWQRILEGQLREAFERGSGSLLAKSARFSAATYEFAAEIEDLRDCEALVVCLDSDEAPCGAAFAVGFSRALGKPIFSINSKSTQICAGGGYKSSRNLMLDYSVSRSFGSIQDFTDDFPVIMTRQ